MDEQREGYFDKVKESAAWLKKKTSAAPCLAITLTAGLEGPLPELENKRDVPLSQIPHFPAPRAQGHEGRLFIGELAGREIAVLKGRCHFYEGHAPGLVVFPYFVLNELGAASLIATNAAGGIRRDLNPGDVMVIRDHVNAMGENPLRGIAMQRETNQFTDMKRAYDPRLRQMARQEAKKLDVKLKEGIYIAVSGPSYETKAEIKFFRRSGADASGMSTVFETIACNFLGMKVLAFSCITNPSAERHKGRMDHEEVLAAVKEAAPRFSSLVSACARRILALEQKK